jgi:hypothetical protein
VQITSNILDQAEEKNVKNWKKCKGNITFRQ